MPDIEAGPQRKQTICEIHRRMYRIIMERDPNDPLIPLLRTSLQHGKEAAQYGYSIQAQIR